MKEDHQKALKRVTLFFLLNPVPFNSQNYQKQKRPRTSDQSLCRLWNRFTKIPLYISYVLSDQVWWCNVEPFLSYSKNCICKFMQANLWYHKLIIPLSFLFESGKCGKEGIKLQKFEYLKNKKSSLDEIKNISQFLKAYHLMKKKNW